MKRMAKRKPTAETTAPALVEEAVPAPAPSKDYTVLARRYRPQQLADLVGQEPVAQALANALQTGRVAGFEENTTDSSYLFHYCIFLLSSELFQKKYTLFYY